MREHDEVSVVVFCGGRGARSLTAALLERQQVRLSLAVNGYDNGQSTGLVRTWVPGLLGPSDFRKNLSRHISDRSPAERGLRWLLEHRLPDAAPLRSLRAVEAALGGRSDTDVPTDVLQVPDREGLLRDLQMVLARAERAGDLSAAAGAVLADCSVGNLLFAGHYLRCGRDFNKTVRYFADLTRARFALHNVTDGTDAYLVALKTDGELMADEAQIVAAQSATPIGDIALLPSPLSEAHRQILTPADSGQRRRVLHRASQALPINPELVEALAEADLIVLAPGTQHSSLLPSYLTTGLRSAMQAAGVPIVQIVNIHEDHDIQGWDAARLVRRTDRALGGPTVTHALVHAGNGGKHVRFGGEWPGSVEPIVCDVEDSERPGTHDGGRTVSALMDVLDPARAVPA